MNLISKLILKSGSKTGEPATATKVSAVTIFVGPNNSGKSRVLHEIESFLRGRVLQDKVILDRIELSSISEHHARIIVDKLSSNADPKMARPDLIVTRYRNEHITYSPEQMFLSLQDAQNSLNFLCANYFSLSTLKLDGANRLYLIQEQPAGNLQDLPSNCLQAIFKNDHKRLELRKIIREAFGLSFIVDPTNLGTLRVRLSKRDPLVVEEERGITDAAIKFHSAAQPIESASDGVRAFTGILTEVLAGDPTTIIIDEAEAFLHPSLAQKLGLELSNAAAKEHKNIFVSTHSPAFLMGCVQSDAAVNIIRLTYHDGAATSRQLASERVLELMRNPLLRSTGILSGLFYDCVIITEADADRAFYQEINERLLRFKPNFGIRNALFINAQNWQTIKTLVSPLRELGIPTVAIMDIDVIIEGGKPWTQLLDALCMPEILHSSIAALRASIKSTISAKHIDLKRDGGITALDATDRQAADSLLTQLSEYGLFVVPVGELESWLKPLNVKGHGPNWLIEIFEKMGDNANSEGYLTPSDGDVWEFISKIKGWIDNPDRKGIPV